MKKSLSVVLLIAAIIGVGGFAKAQVTTVFSYTGGSQNYTVPAGVTKVIVDAVGATGGVNSYWPTVGIYTSRGGNGGRVQCVLTVNPGDVLQVFVGGVGTNGAATGTAAGGFNGGGNATASGSYGGGGGGGASDIRATPYALGNRIVVAGGGGGSGLNTGEERERGGDGGATTGQNGYTSGSTAGTTGGQGGTQLAGGNGGSGGGSAGTQGVGGNNLSTTGAGGGGGGYFGGGGGGSSWSGGGGGSSYTDPVLATQVFHTQGANITGNGQVVITTVPANYTPTLLGYTGVSQTFTATIAGNYLIDAQSGIGGSNNQWPKGNWPSQGGSCGRVQCALTMAAGQVFQVNVGGAGGNADNPQSTAAAVAGTAGFNGGASGAITSNFGSGGGGGATDIRVTPFALTNRLIVAGGGGGAGLENAGTNQERGGPGGGTIGGTGFFLNSQTASGGQGGGTAAGGTGGNPGGTAGTFGIGGSLAGTAAGAGGGGYYGGGSGNTSWSGGGGGSSYTDAVLATGVSHTQGFQAIGNGTLIVLTPVPPVWYSSTTGGDAANVNNWWSNNNNTGSHPVAADFTTAGETWIFQGAMTCSSTPFTQNGVVTITAGASFTPFASGVWNIGGSYTNNGTFTHNNSTVVFNGSGAQTLSGILNGTTGKFNNIQFNNATGSWSFGATSADVAGTFTIASGTVTASSNTLQIAGTYSNSGLFTNNGGTVNFNNSASINMSGNLNGTSKFNNLNFNGTALVNVISNMDVGGNLTVNSGSVAVSAATVNVTGNFSNASTYTAGSVLNVGGNWTNTGNFSHAFGSVNMTGTTGGLSMNGLMTGVTGRFNNLTFNGAGGAWTFGATNADVVGNFTISAGTVTASSGNINVGGSYSNSGTFTHNNGTVTFNAGPSSLSGSMTTTNKFNNISFTGGSTYTFLANADVAGNFTNTSGNVVAPTTLQIAGNYTNSSTFTNNGGTVIMNGTSSPLTMSGNMTGGNRFNLLTFNGAGGAWTINNNIDIASNLNITNGTVITAAATTMNLLGNWTKASDFVAGAGSVINVGSAGTGNWSNSGGTFTANTSTVNMVGSGALTVTGAMTGSNKFNVLTFNNAGGSWSFGANSADVGSNFTISAGTVTAPSTTLQIAGNYSNSGIFTHNGGTVVMNGTTGGLSLTGNMTLGTSSRFNNLTFNGLGGAWTFGGTAVDVATNFTITQGTVTAPSSNLNIGASYTNATGTFNNNNGTVTMNGASGGSFNGAMTTTNKFFNLTVNGSGTWTFGANAADVANNFTISAGTVTAPSTTLQIGANYSNSGTFSNNGGLVNFNATSGVFSLSGNMTTATNRFNNLTFNGVGGNWSFSNNADVAGNFNMSNGTVSNGPATFTVLGNFNINAGTFASNTGGGATIFVGGSWLNSGTFTANTSTVNFNGAGAGNTLTGTLVAPSNFYNLTFSGTGSWSFGGVAALVANNFTHSSGTVTLPSSTLTVNANWSNTGGTLNHNNGTVTMSSGSGGLTLSTLLSGVANKFFNLTFTGGGAWTINNNIDCGGNFTISSGTVTSLGGLTMNITGTMSNSGTFSPGTTNAINVSTNWANPGTFNASTSTVTMNGTSSGLTLSGNMTGANQFNLLTFNGIGGGWTLSNNVDVASNFTITNGGVTTPANHILNVGTSGLGNFSKSGDFVAGTTSTINVTGSWAAPSGSFSASTSTVNMNGNNAGLTFSGLMVVLNKFNNLTFSGNGTWTFNAIPADVGGDFQITGLGTVTTPTTTLNIFGNMVNSGTLTSGAAGTINLGSSTAGKGNWTNNNVFNASTGTVNMVGTVAGITLNGIMSLASGTGRFNNLTFNGTGGTFTFNANADVTNNATSNFTITAGTVNTPANHILNINGNWSNAGTFNAGATSQINVNGVSAQNCWNNNGAFSASTSTVTFQGTTAGTRTLLGGMTGTNKFYNLTFGGTLATVIYTFGATPCDVANNFTILNLNKVTAPSTLLQVGGSWSNTGTTSGAFTHNSGTVNFNGTVAGLTLSGNMTLVANRFNNLTFNGVGGNWTCNNDVHAFGNFTITNGTVTAPLGGTIIVFGNWFNGGTFIHNTGTVTMSGTVATLTMGGNMTTSPFYNLTFNAAGTWNMLTPNVTVVNNFTKSAGTFVAPSGTLTVGGNWSHTGGTFTHNNGTVLMNGVLSGTYNLTSVMTGTSSFYNLTFNSAVVGSVAWTFSANAQMANNFVITNGTVTPTGSGTMTIGGNYTNNGVFVHNNSTVVMNGTVTGLSLNGNMTAATFSPFYNLQFNGAGGVWGFGATGATAADVANAFTITNGTVTAPSTTLQVAGNWSNSGTYNNNNGLVNLNGTVLQTLSGANSTVFNNLTLNNAGGATNTTDATVNGQFTMTAGGFSLATNNLTFGPTAPAIAGVFTPTVMITANGTGQVRKQMTSNGSFLFPVGDNLGPNYTPITINFTSGTYNPGNYYGLNIKTVKHPNNANVNNFLKRYWSMVTSNITSPVYSATSATYVPADVTGTEALLSGGDYPGSLPWLKFSPVNTVSHTFSTTSVTSVNSDFTAITTAPPTVGATASTAICFGNSTVINTLAPTGDPTLSYTWAPANGLNATVGYAVVASPTVTTTYTVTITDGNGFTNTATSTVTVNPLPTPITGTGTGTLCTGFTLALASTPTTGAWSSSNPYLAAVDPVSGIVSGLSPGSATITYTLPVTGCFVTTSPITILPSPAPITGANNVCVGATSALVTTSPPGVWSSSAPAVGSVSPVGVVSGLAAGTPTITYTLTSNACYAVFPMSVNALPSLYSITGGGSYCAGTPGVHVGLSNSNSGINYQLYNGALLVGIYPGTGVPLDFGFISGVGTYSVVAVNAATGCSKNMTGAVTVIRNTLPTPYPMGSGGSICVGDPTGVDIILTNSDAGILYQLYKDGVAIPGALMIGASGSLRDFGYFGAAGVYTVVGQDASTGCTSNMTGSATIVVNPLPNVFNVTVTNSGFYCLGGAGVNIGLNFSNPGINYQLYNTAGAVGSLVAGSSSALDFGAYTAADVYTVSATNATTGCTSSMSGSATVTINPLPVAQTMTGGGDYCLGGTGVHVGMLSSDLNVNYQLYNGATAIGAPATGGAAPFDFGLETAAGTYTVTATDAITGCMNNMTGSATVIIDPLPTPYIVGGGGAYCIGDTGVHITLSSSDFGTDYQLTYHGGTFGPIVHGTGSGVLDMGLVSGTGTYGVVATNTLTTCTGNMAGSVIVTTNPLPTAYRITGGGNYCAGSGGLHVGLSFSDIGVTYQLLNGASPVGSPLNGSSTGLDFGAQIAGGTYTILATNNITGCTKLMSGSVTIVVNPLPNAYAVTSSTSTYCAGGAGVHIYLSSSDVLINYQLYVGSTAVGTPMSGSAGSSIDFGAVTAAGIYTVKAINTVTGCTRMMTGSASISITPLPVAYTVTGGGNICVGSTGTHVGLSGSTAGVQYQLYLRGGVVGAPIPGTGTALDFGLQTAAGNYTVIATNTTTTCTNNMTGSVTITVNALPTAYTVTGGGSYCNAGTGVVVGLSGSQLGVNYQLYVGTTPVGAAIAGTSHSLDFGLQTIAGAYTVVATSASSACTNNMAGSVNVSVTPTPAQYSVYGGGGYCAGTTGVHVRLSWSDAGVNYQLYNGATPVGSFMSGVSGPLDFGLQTTPGVYKVVATNAATSCTSDMLSTTTISINPLPVAYSVTGGGNNCAGAPGVHVGLYIAAIGVNYQLYNGTTPVGSPMPGGGVMFDFGLQTAAGVYTVVAANATTGCTNNMTGSATVTTAPTVVPSVSVSTTTGDTVCNGIVTAFTATPVNGGSAPTYLWKVNGVNVGIGSTYHYAASNNDVVTAVMTSNALCATPAVVDNSVTMDVLPTVVATAVISGNPGNILCPGTPVTFTAVTTNGGTAPGYTWYKNNAPVSGGTSYTYMPADNDVVLMELTSNARCRVSDTVFSNDVKITVDKRQPAVTIVTNPGTLISPNQLDTLIAVATNAGRAPSYQWSINGTPIPGATSSMLISDQFANKDVVTCMVTPDNVCNGNNVFNSITITITTVSVKQVDGTGTNVKLVPNPNNGAFIIKGTLGTTADAEVTLEITDMVGQVVHTQKIMTHGGNINQRVLLSEALANGMYMLNLHSGNENIVFHMVVRQ